MNKPTQDLRPGMLMETPKSATDEIEMYDVVFGDLGEERLTTQELMELAGKPYKWCCNQPHCRHFIRFTLDQLDAIPFLIVRHLERIHNLTHEQIEEAQPGLKKEIIHQRWLEGEPTPDRSQQASDNPKNDAEETKMTNNKPIKKVQVGQMSVAVWENEFSNSGESRTVMRVTVDKRYKDASGNYKSTGSFDTNDIPRLILALEKAYEFMTCKPRDNGDGEEAANHDHD